MDTQDLMEQEVRKASNLSRRDFRFTVIIFCVVVAVGFLFSARNDSDKNLLVWNDTNLVLTLPNQNVYVIDYKDIDSIALIQNPDFGSCIDGELTDVHGYGVWRNDAVGEYILCTYRSFDSLIQINTESQVFWIGYASSESTELLYEGFQQTLSGFAESAGQ